jgi:DNA-binding NarL/FixJ family response regulator
VTVPPVPPVPPEAPLGPSEALDPSVVRVLVADDHAPTRAGIRASLVADGFDVVAECSSARQAIDLARQLRPDVALLDIHMPGNGISAAAEITLSLPEIAVVMLTYSREEDDLFDAVRAGAQGYLLKDMDPDRLGAALRGVLTGEAALPRSLVAKVLDEFRGRQRRRVLVRSKPAGQQLTSRQWEILELLQQGLTTEEIATRLFVAPGTVRVHVSTILKKLRVRSRDEAVRLMRD